MEKCWIAITQKNVNWCLQIVHNPYLIKSTDLDGLFGTLLVLMTMNGWIAWFLTFWLESRWHSHSFHKVTMTHQLLLAANSSPKYSLYPFWNFSTFWIHFDRISFDRLLLYLAYLSTIFTIICTALSYAQLANLNPVQGLYAAILPSACYTLLGSSMQVNYIHEVLPLIQSILFVIQSSNSLLSHIYFHFLLTSALSYCLPYYLSYFLPACGGTSCYRFPPDWHINC